MDFFVQHYGPGHVGRFVGSGGMHGESVDFSSTMYKMRVSSDRVCIYDNITKVGSKECHTFFLLGNGTDTFVGSTPPHVYNFSGTVFADEKYPDQWKNKFYLQSAEIPNESPVYNFEGLGGDGATDFIKGRTIPREPIDGYFSFGIIKPEGGELTPPGAWYKSNGSWSYAPYDLSKMNFNSNEPDTLGLPMYYNEQDEYDPGNVFNSVAYDIVVNSGLSLGQIIDKIRTDTLLDGYLADFIVGNGVNPNGLVRNYYEPVNKAVFNTYEAPIKHAYAGIPGLTYKGGSRAYDGGWTFYNIYVTKSLKFAQDYIDNGTPPPDGYKNTINTDGSKKIDPKFSKPKDKGDSDDPTEPDDKDNSKRDSQTIKLPKENGVSSPSNNWYQMTRAQLHRFIYYFWNDIGKNATDWFNDIQGLYNNLSEAVLGVKYFPCTSKWLYDIDPGQPPTITIGRYSTTFQATQIKSNAKLTKIGSYAIYERYKNFLDYTATRIELFLPYMGWVELPTQKVMGTKIIVYFGVDMATTQGMYVIKSDGMIVFQSTFNFGINIPITLSSSVEEVKSAVNTGVSLASTALSVAMTSTVSPVAGGMLAVSSAQNLIPQGYDSLHMIGNATANSGQLGGKRCAICITRSIPKQPGLYGSRIGFCYNKKKQLAQLSGLTVIENPRIDSTGYATEQEVEEIYSLMKKGIIL